MAGAAVENLLHRETAEPEMRGLEPVLDPVKSGLRGKAEDLGGRILVEEHAGYSERNHNPPI